MFEHVAHHHRVERVRRIIRLRDVADLDLIKLLGPRFVDREFVKVDPVHIPAVTLRVDEKISVPATDLQKFPRRLLLEKTKVRTKRVRSPEQGGRQRRSRPFLPLLRVRMGFCRIFVLAVRVVGGVKFDDLIDPRMRLDPYQPALVVRAACEPPDALRAEQSVAHLLRRRRSRRAAKFAIRLVDADNAVRCRSTRRPRRPQ